MAKTKWEIDHSHSSVDFSVKHMVIAKVKGTFDKFEATIVADPEDLTTAEIEFSVDTASVNTRNEDRDKHLRSADFFDSEHFPQMTFKALKIEKKSAAEYKVSGELTIRGKTRLEFFTVTYEGQGKDPWGGERAGFSVSGKLNRTDFGLVWNAALETGGFLVGDQVDISLEIEGVKKA